MLVPEVCVNNIRRMYNLFAYEDSFAKLNYVECLESWTGERLWRIEFRVKDQQQHVGQNELTAFIEKLKQARGSFRVKDVYYNLYHRIYINVHSGNSPNVRTGSEIKQKSDHQRTRDQARSIEFKKRLAEVKTKVTSLGLEVKLENKPLSVQMRYLTKKLKSHENDNNSKKAIPEVKKIAFVSGGIQEPSISEKPVAKFTNVSAKSDDKTYIKMRLLAPEFQDRIRVYIATLMCNSYSYVSASGYTRMSVESYLKSEGFPIGEEIKTLYMKTMVDRGFTPLEVEADVQGVRDYERSIRFIRLQTAQEKSRAWLGLKGGSTKIQYVAPAEVSYYALKFEEAWRNNTRVNVVQISDGNGSIDRFN